MCTLRFLQQNKAELQNNVVLNQEKLLQTFQMTKLVYDDVYLSRGEVFKWYSRFKNSRKSLEDNSGEGRHSTSTVNANVKLMRVAMSRSR